MPLTGPSGSERCPRSGMPRQPLSPCVAGERLCSTEEATAGSGTYTRHGFIFSSLAGCLERRNEDSEVSAAAARLLLPGADCRAPRLHSLLGDWAPTGFGWWSCARTVPYADPRVLPCSCPWCRW